jgi:hypothetical protein
MVLGGLAGCDGVFNLDHVESVPADAPQPGLLAWYTMDSLDINALADTTGNGHTGLCASPSCPTSTAGRIGNALHFDGSQDIIRVASAADLNVIGPFTVMAWVRLDMLASDYACAVNKVLGTSNAWQICISSTGKPMFGTEGESLMSTTAIPIQQWHHLAGRWDGTTKQLLIDGLERDASLMSPTFGSGEVLIGADVDSAFTAGFPGSIDDVRIYGRAVTSQEILVIASR